MSNPDSVKLYHGTSLQAALSIRASGFSSVDPTADIRDLEVRYGVPPGTAGPSNYDLQRYRRGDVSFSTGWCVAADYAREHRGSEAWGIAVSSIGWYVLGRTANNATVREWIERQPAAEPAVVTIEASVEDLTAAAPPDCPLRPDRLIQRELVAGVPLGPQEILLKAPIPASWVVAVDRLDPCEGGPGCAGRMVRTGSRGIAVMSRASYERCALCAQTV